MGGAAGRSPSSGVSLVRRVPGAKPLSPGSSRTLFAVRFYGPVRAGHSLGRAPRSCGRGQRWTGIYNSFLAAHGLGKELRNAGMALTVSNLILNVALIPQFGAAGAAWASLIVNLGAHIVGYRRYRRQLVA